MEPRFILRPAVINDIPSIMEIEQICFDLDSFSKRQFAYLISQAKGSKRKLEEDNFRSECF